MQLRQEKLVAAYASRQIEWQDRHYHRSIICRTSSGYPTRLPNSSASPRAVLAQRHQRHRAARGRNGGSNLEIVVKTIGPQLQRVAGITGATVSATGEIVLILNPVQLALKEVAPAVDRPRSAQAQAVATQRRSWWSTIRSRCASPPDGMLERHGYIVGDRARRASKRWRSCWSSFPT